MFWLIIKNKFVVMSLKVIFFSDQRFDLYIYIYVSLHGIITDNFPWVKKDLDCLLGTVLGLLDECFNYSVPLHPS